MNKINTLKGVLNMKKALSILALCVMIANVAYADKLEDSGKTTSGFDDKGDVAIVKVYEVTKEHIEEVTIGQLNVKKAELEKEIASRQTELDKVNQLIDDADKIEKGN